MMPKVSVIVPIYNVETYLPQCLDSLAAQRLEELEIILVNDGSLDSSGSIAKEYVKKYPNRFVYYEKGNGGLSSARNVGVAFAHGEYIGFVDSDDYVEPDFYLEMYNKAVQEDAQVVCCSYSDVYPNRFVKRYYNPQLFGMNVLESPKLLSSANSFAWNKIFHLNYWKENKFIFPEGQWFEDSALIYNVMLTANRVSLVNYPFYYYRRGRDDSITRQVDPHIFDIIKSTQSIVDYYKTHDAFDTLYDELEFLCLRHITARFKTLRGSSNKELSTRFVIESFDFLDKNFPAWRKNRYMNPKKSDIYQKTSKFVQKNKLLCALAVCLPAGTAPVFKRSLKFFKQTKNNIGKEARTERNKEKKRFFIQKYGLLVLRDVQDILAAMGIISFADFGTCLGLVRENKLLEHDLDVDIGVIAGSEQRDNIRIHLEKCGYKLWRQYVYENRVVEESYRYYNVKVDLNYYQMTESSARTWLFYTKPDYQYHDALTRHIVCMNYSSIPSVFQQVFDGIEIALPQNPEKLLEEKYGPNWRVPDTEWIYWKSPAATPLDELGHIIAYSYKGSIRPSERRDLQKNYEERIFEPYLEEYQINPAH